MATKIEKFYKKLLRFLGWLLDNIPNKAPWLAYFVIFAISFIIFWFNGLFVLMVVYAIFLWIVAGVMILVTTMDKIKGGKGLFLKAVRSFMAKGDVDTETDEEIDQEKREKKVEDKVVVQPKQKKEEKKETPGGEKNKSNLPGIDGGDDEPVY